MFSMHELTVLTATCLPRKLQPDVAMHSATSALHQHASGTYFVGSRSDFMASEAKASKAVAPRAAPRLT
jgi:hypothetical protein